MQRQWIGIALVASVVMAGGLSACGKDTSAKTVQPGSTVTLTYALAANNQPIIPDNAPQTMKLTVGEGKLPPLFEKNLVGLPVGAAKAIVLKPEQAFGPERKELIVRVARTSLPAGELKEGTLLGSATAPMKIVKILEDGTVVIDRNHPLAGKNLLYKVRVQSIE